MAATGVAIAASTAAAQSAWNLGQVNDGTLYSVVLTVNNTCSWAQQVKWHIEFPGFFKAGARPVDRDAFVPGRKALDLTLFWGTGEVLVHTFSNAHITVTHDEATQGGTVCLAETADYTIQVTSDGKPAPKPGAQDKIGGQIIELDEIAQKDRTVPRVHEGGASGVLPGPPEPKKPGDEAGKRHGSRPGGIKWPYLAGGGAAIVGGVVVLGGGGGPDTPGGTGPTSPTNTPPPITSLCGNFTGNLAPTQVGCGFSSAFSMVAELTCSADGMARLVIRRADNDPEGQRFEYTGRVAGSGALEFTGSGNLRGLATYTGRFVGTVSGDGRVLQGTNTVTFTEPGCAGQTLVQSINGTR
jgi:hypothetical protein